VDDAPSSVTDTDLSLESLERPPEGWDDAPTAKLVYERRSCGLVRVSVTRIAIATDD
jgi:hypothetical protein